MTNSKNVLVTDVLVIGTGFAGGFAAIRAKELGVDVIMVDQVSSGFSGMSAIGTHITRVVLPEDDLDKAFEGAVLESEYMVDQEYAKGALAETWDRFQEFLSLGADFRRDDNGQIKWYFTDTFYPGFRQRLTCWEPMASYKHILKVKVEAVRRGVKVFDRIMITELLTSNGKVVGAVGFNTRDGDYFVFKAKAVVIASGTFNGGGLLGDPSLSGDGIAMALRCGAELRGMEFGKVMMTAQPPKGGGPWPIRISIPPEKETIITNEKGDEFLEKYELGKRLPSRIYDGPPWNVQMSAMLQECREGRGPCYADYRDQDKADYLRVLFGSAFDQKIKQIKLSGLALDRIKYELMLGPGGGQGGGIRIDPNGNSTVQGLFAAGVASDMCCAQHHSVPANMMGSHITGRRAGESAAKYSTQQPSPSVSEEHLEKLRKEIYKSLNRKSGIDEDEIRIKLSKPWVNIDLRNETRLNKGLAELQELGQEAEEMKVVDCRGLVQYHKFINYIQCTKTVAVAALARHETRLEHMREDYPLTDNKNWLKWVIVSLKEGTLQTNLENIPFNRWKYKPEPKVFDRLQLKEEVH